MLNTNKIITINGNSMMDDKIVVYMNATLNTDGSSNETINKNIQNQELYASNKEAVRKDMRDFEDLVFAEQDKLSKSEI